MPVVMIQGFECNRCRYQWVPRPTAEKGSRPVTCPNCGSPYWDKERKRPAPPVKAETVVGKSKRKKASEAP